MTRDEAIAECDRWFAYLDRQAEKAKTLQDAAAMARRGALEGDQEKMDEARRIVRQVDQHPTVYDGARLRDAVELLIRHNRKMERAIKDEERLCWEVNRTMSPHLLNALTVK